MMFTHFDPASFVCGMLAEIVLIATGLLLIHCARRALK